MGGGGSFRPGLSPLPGLTVGAKNSPLVGKVLPRKIMTNRRARPNKRGNRAPNKTRRRACIWNFTRRKEGLAFWRAQKPRKGTWVHGENQEKGRNLATPFLAGSKRAPGGKAPHALSVKDGRGQARRPEESHGKRAFWGVLLMVVLLRPKYYGSILGKYYFVACPPNRPMPAFGRISAGRRPRGSHQGPATANAGAGTERQHGGGNVDLGCHLELVDRPWNRKLRRNEVGAPATRHRRGKCCLEACSCEVGRLRP